METFGEGWQLVRREYPTAIGPVDLLCRDAGGTTVAVEIKRRGEIDGVEQLTRYLELLNRDPLLAPVKGVFAAQEIKPQARVLAADRGIDCVTVDYAVLKGTDDPSRPAVLTVTVGNPRAGRPPSDGRLPRSSDGRRVGTVARELTEVGVVGLGTMGAGIAEVLARAGLSVTAVEVDRRRPATAAGRTSSSPPARRSPAASSTPESATRSVAGSTSRTALEDLAAAELVVEAIPERMELKAQLFSKLDAICPPDTILATNTSSLSVTELSVTTGRPGKVIGMHFFNPAPVMKLVEVVRTVVTEPSVVEDVEALAARLGKIDVTIGDRAGFIANALLFGYLNHAVSMFENRYASREDIDAAMRLGCGLPMGPLALMDLIGIDTAYEILVTMYQQSRNRLHAPARSSSR